MNLAALEPRAREIIGRYDEPRAAMLPLLWLAQSHIGHIPPEAERWVGGLLGVAVSHVREVVSFYSMFRTRPAGRHELRVCTSLPCMLRGAENVLAQLEARFHVRPGETTSDGELTLTEVECLCACEIAPAGQLDEQFVGPLDDDTIEAIAGGAIRPPADSPSIVERQPFVSTDGPVISPRFRNVDGTWWDAYVADGGYVAAAKALSSMTPSQVVDEVSKANLRGLGGAGFPTGRKWSFIPKGSPKPKYLVVNADEGEPGTFKDRYILERDPHALLEGMIIAASAIGSHKAYVYIRGEYFRPAERFARAVAEAYERGWLGKNVQGSGFDLDVVIHRGAGAYICGEETALLTSIEGGKGFPKLKPPFPAISGLFQCPTIVNNVETLACVPFILREGADRFAALGTPKQGGTRLFSVCGHVNRPGLYEAPVGITLRELIDRHAQGVRRGHSLKAVIPGGMSAKVLAAEEIDVAMDFDSLLAAGTMAGSGGVIVMDDSASMVEALQSAAKFFAHESCGQCSPCGEGRLQDLDDLLSIARAMEGKTICVFADAAAWPVQSYITKFRAEFEEHITIHGIADCRLQIADCRPIQSAISNQQSAISRSQICRT
ncbi:MAG: NADH-quinone oxidoreductase subunit NuoF [Acidobacteria bacterium]|nr:MAG: NADH-quinone oxidoreductase subunit NuoF [Acidobacteriota bacterium]